MTDDWKRNIPFRRHLNAYLFYKIAVLVIVVVIGLRVMGWL